MLERPSSDWRLSGTEKMFSQHFDISPSESKDSVDHFLATYINSCYRALKRVKYLLFLKGCMDPQFGDILAVKCGQIVLQKCAYNAMTCHKDKGSVNLVLTSNIKIYTPSCTKGSI